MVVVRLPAPGQKFFDMVGRLRGGTGLHVCEQSLRIDAIHLGRHDQAVLGGGPGAPRRMF